MHQEQGSEQSNRSADFAAVRSLLWWWAVETAKEFVSPINKMDFHYEFAIPGLLPARDKETRLPCGCPHSSELDHSTDQTLAP